MVLGCVFPARGKAVGQQGCRHLWMLSVLPPDSNMQLSFAVAADETCWVLGPCNRAVCSWDGNQGLVLNGSPVGHSEPGR